MSIPSKKSPYMPETSLYDAIMSGERVGRIPSPYTYHFIPLSDKQFMPLNQTVKLESLLKELSEINKTTPIINTLSEPISELIEKVIRSEDTDAILNALSLVGTYNTTYSLYLIKDLMIKLFKLHPILKEYLNENLSLFPKGIEIAINNLRERYNSSDLILSCEDSYQIKTIFQEICKQPCKRAIILYTPEQAHVTPIYFENDGKCISILLTDSTGIIRNSYYSNEVFMKFTPKHLKLRCYAFYPKRQNDEYSCSIFSLLDMKKIIEMNQDKIDIFAWIRENNDIDIDDTNDRIMMKFYKLPSEMIKTTQSLSRLERYQTQSPSLFNIERVFSRSTTPQSELEEENYLPGNDLCISSNGKEINKYIERNHFMFLNIILSHLRSTHII